MYLNIIFATVSVQELIISSLTIYKDILILTKW